MNMFKRLASYLFNRHSKTQAQTVAGATLAAAKIRDEIDRLQRMRRKTDNKYLKCAERIRELEGQLPYILGAAHAGLPIAEFRNQWLHGFTPSPLGERNQRIAPGMIPHHLREAWTAMNGHKYGPTVVELRALEIKVGAAYTLKCQEKLQQLIQELQQALSTFDQQPLKVRKLLQRLIDCIPVDERTLSADLGL